MEDKNKFPREDLPENEIPMLDAEAGAPILFAEEIPEQAPVTSQEEFSLPLSEPILAEPENLPEQEILPIPDLTDIDFDQINALLSEEEPQAPVSEAPQTPQVPVENANDLTMLHIPEVESEPAPMEVLQSNAAEPDRTFRAGSEESEEFQTMFRKAPQSEKQAPAQPRHVRKGRPKRKKGVGLLGIPHLLATAIWLLIIVAIGTSLGRMIWVCAADVLAFGRESKKVSITITQNDTTSDIAQKLGDAGLIRYPGLFELYAGIAVDEGEIRPGTYELDTLYDYHALVVQMGPRSSTRGVIEVLIPEGLNCRQIFELLAEKNVCTVEELEEYAANGELDDYWFLEGVERGDKYCLEGYLFPDTYQFYLGGSARHTLEKMLSGFEYRIKEEHTNLLPTLNERLSAMMKKNGCSAEFIAEHQMTMRDVIIVASLIEEETASSKESPNIASVIYNRLTQDQEYERYLGIDAATIYALGEHKETLTAEDLAIDSPYNTRLYPGLVPGPISNPGLESIMAALNPEDTSYYYYVLNPEEGLHDFSKTLEEHEAKAEKYAAYVADETEPAFEGDDSE